MGLIWLHPKHREKSSTSAKESKFIMPRILPLQIHIHILSDSCFQTTLLQQGGGFWTVVKTCEPNKHISKEQCSPASCPPACEAQMSREKAHLCVLDIHASISQAKGTVNFPMETGTTIKTAAAPPVCVMPTFSLNVSAPWSEIVSPMYRWSGKTPPHGCHHATLMPPPIQPPLAPAVPCFTLHAC